MPEIDYAHQSVSPNTNEGKVDSIKEEEAMPRVIAKRELKPL